MTQQERELLLKDLCARLPYGVKVRVLIHRNDPTSEEILTLNGFAGDSEYTLWVHDKERLAKYGCSGRGFRVDEIKPYLRPMSSMTDEERKEYQFITERWMYDANYSIADSIDWLNEHHFDYRGLMDKGLAIAVTEENTSYKD